jgi:hypothetical protein
MVAHYVTLDESINQFEFVCPVFNVQTKMRHCTKLRDLVYSGARPDVRKGCQACISASKCPAAEIVRRISYGKGQVPDDYGSRTSVVGKLRKDVLEKIHRVIVMERTLNEFAVPDAERQLIDGASDRIGKMVGAAPLPSDDGPPSRNFATETAAPKKPRKTKPQADNSNNAINEAAATGDLAAAVSAA